MVQLISLLAAVFVFLGKVFEQSDTIKENLKLQKVIYWGVILMTVVLFGALIFDLVRPKSDDSWFHVIDGIDVPILLYDDKVVIVYANESALKFYNVPLHSIIGLDPQQLHVLVKPYMLNFKEWSEEQMTRNTQALQRSLNSKSKVPMHMSTDHVFGAHNWYLTSHNIMMHGERYLVTRFSLDANEP